MKLSHPFFASSDRNLLEQITYITLVSLYPGDIPNYRGMTVGTAITSSFEDSLETLWQEHRTWPYFSPSQGMRILVFSSGASCYNHYKQPEESWYVRKHFNRSFHATFHGSNITEGETRQIFYCLPRYRELGAFFSFSAILCWKFKR